MKILHTHNGLSLGVMNNYAKTGKLYVCLSDDHICRNELKTALKGKLLKPIGGFGIRGFDEILLSNEHIELVSRWQKQGPMKG